MDFQSMKGHLKRQSVWLFLILTLSCCAIWLKTCACHIKGDYWSPAKELADKFQLIHEILPPPQAAAWRLLIWVPWPEALIMSLVCSLCSVDTSSTELHVCELFLSVPLSLWPSIVWLSFTCLIHTFPFKSLILWRQGILCCSDRWGQKFLTSILLFDSKLCECFL